MLLFFCKSSFILNSMPATRSKRAGPRQRKDWESWGTFNIVWIIPQVNRLMGDRWASWSGIKGVSLKSSIIHKQRCGIAYHFVKNDVSKWHLNMHLQETSMGNLHICEGTIDAKNTYGFCRNICCYRCNVILHYMLQESGLLVKECKY